MYNVVRDDSSEYLSEQLETYVLIVAIFNPVAQFLVGHQRPLFAGHLVAHWSFSGPLVI